MAEKLTDFAREENAGMRKAAALRRVLSLSIANSVGFSGTTSMALWITVIVRVLPVPPWWGSVVGAGQLLAAAAGNLVAPALFGALSCESLARGAALVAMVGNAVMMVTMIPSVFAGAALSVGLALGVLLNAVNTMLARAESVQGNYATAQICEVVFSASFYLCGSRIIAELGLKSVFAVLVLLCLVSAFLMHRLSLAGRTLRADRTGSGTKTPIGATLLAILAFVLFFVGQSSFYEHQVAIGRLIGISAIRMGSLMAAAMIGGFMGAISGKLIGERFGIVKPPVILSICMALCLLLVVHTKSQGTFAVMAIAIQALTMATVPYAFAILAALDPSGGLPARGPALLLMGVAGGPLLSEAFLGVGGYPLVGEVAAVVVLTAAILFVASRRSVAGEAGSCDMRWAR